MAMWGKNSLPYKKSPPDMIRPSDGVNTYVNALEISSSEASENSNTSSRNYPTLSPRQGITSTDLELTKVNGATFRGATELHVVDGTTWKYLSTGTFPTYTNVATTLADAEATFLEFNTASKKNTIMFNGTQKKYWDGTTAYDITDANCPATKIIACDDSRMFALKDSTISVSDTADFTNWTTLDAIKIPLVSMIGTGTALVSYNDMIIAWSNQTMHIVYGKNPDEVQVTELIPVGNVGQKATLIHGNSGVLYWVDYNKVMAFTGGLPYEVGQKASEYFKNAILHEKIRMAQAGKYIYISLPYYVPGSVPTKNNITVEFDTERNIWNVWNRGFDNFATVNDELYGISTDGYWEGINGTATTDNATPITWSYTTGVLDWKALKNLKYVTDIYAIVDLPIGSQLVLKYSTSIDGSDFVLLHTFTPSADEQNTRIRIPTTVLQRLKFYRLQFLGEGQSKVHYLEIHGRRGE